MLSFLFHQSLSFLLIIFTYSIPLLSSIRAIYNRDKESYHQWLTYFLLQVILTPLFHILQIHPFLHLLIILWLSLPKFQGALFVYDQIFDGVIWNKYNVEQKIEDRIEIVRDGIKNVVWSIAKDIGWSALCQIGELVTLVTATTANDENDNDDGNGNDNNNATIDAIGDDNDEKGLTKDTGAETDGVGAKKKIPTKMTRKPSHSVIGSLSSFSSVESFSKVLQKENEEELEIYRQDFVQMLQEGLYVFASYSINTSAVNNNEEQASAFRLRVLFYEDMTNGDALKEGEIKHDYFVLQPVEVNENSSSSSEEENSGVEMIARKDIHGFRPVGTNGIQFIATATAATIAPTSVSTTVDPETESDMNEAEAPSMTSSSTSTSSTRSTPIDASFISKEEEEGEGTIHVLADIVLSNTQDRETLLHGLRTCFTTHNNVDVRAANNPTLHTEKNASADIRMDDGNINDDDDITQNIRNENGEKDGNHDANVTSTSTSTSTSASVNISAKASAVNVDEYGEDDGNDDLCGDNGLGEELEDVQPTLNKDTSAEEDDLDHDENGNMDG